VSFRVRLLAAGVAAASTSSVVAFVVWSQRWNIVTITLLIALTWTATISDVDAFVAWHRPSPSLIHTKPAALVTYMVRLGDEGVDIARTSLALVAQAGPVVVLATRHHDFLDDSGISGLRECVRPTMSQALRDAAQMITTDAALVLSASAFPLGDACEAAASELTGNVGWITGAAPAFNNDRYAPGERELLRARSRDAARKLGLVTWEPDATIVRTSLLRDYTAEQHRPNGQWLRSRAAAGWQGASTSEPIAVRAAPSDAPRFWPIQTYRQRGVVADLADAITMGPRGARVAAAGALLRELYAWPSMLWLLAIVMIGRSGTLPLSVSPLVFFGVQGALVVTRWGSSRLMYRVGLHPVDEAREAAYGFPGSLFALRSALTRRVRPLRFTIPDQPLLWIALVLTLVTTIPLLDRRTSGRGAVGIAVGLALATLTATWVFTLRAFGTRGWDRATYRLALDLPATIDGEPARTIDASPAGLSLITAARLVPGSAAIVTVSFDNTAPSTVRAHVTAVRRARGRSAIGLALTLDPSERVRWVRDLFAATGATKRAPHLPIPSAARHRLTFEREHVALPHRIATVIQLSLVITVSLVVASALLLAFLGYRPMVERSGSMKPALHVGDVVIADWVRIDSIHTGEIISFANADEPDLITHRVQQVRTNGDITTVTTKGDANPEPEQWTAPRYTLVGHVIAKIPKIGTMLVVLGESSTRRILLKLTALILLLATITGSLRALRTYVRDMPDR